MKCKISIIIMVLVVFMSGCNADQEVTSDGLLTVSKITAAFSESGIMLKKSEQSVPDILTLNGIKPKLFKMTDINNNDTLVYIFDSYSERKKAIDEYKKKREKFQKPFVKEAVTPHKYEAKNAIIFVAYSIEDMMSTDHHIKNIGDTVFEKLNDGKYMTFKGKGTDWEATIELKYYENEYIHENGSIDYDQFHWKRPILKYEKSGIENVGEVSYKFTDETGSSSSSSGISLNQDGYIHGGHGGSNCTRPDENSVYTMTIRWNDKEETFELKVEESFKG